MNIYNFKQLFYNEKKYNKSKKSRKKTFNNRIILIDNRFIIENKMYNLINKDLLKQIKEKYNKSYINEDETAFKNYINITIPYNENLIHYYIDAYYINLFWMYDNYYELKNKRNKFYISEDIAREIFLNFLNMQSKKMEDKINYCESDLIINYL